MAEVIAEICALTDGPVSAEVTSPDLETMLKEGRYLRTIAPNVAVKVPLTEAGLRACKALSDEGTPVNVTLCFSAPQALLAAKAGAAFISPFIGRLDDIGQDGLQLIADVVQIYRNYNFRTEVLAASIRHPVHVLACAKLGAHVGTMPPAVIRSLMKHPLTDKGVEQFTADWAKTGQSIL
jgi:transaldolase